MFRIICLIAAKGTVLVTGYTHFIPQNTSGIYILNYYGVSSNEVDTVWFQMHICSFSILTLHLFCQKFTATGSALFASTEHKQNCQGLNID